VTGSFQKIVSGGQTGADRAALDWALAHGVAHGGWCPRGRKAEDGRIPPSYDLVETPSADYLQRNEWNVRDSDATVIFTQAAELGGGSRRTSLFAAKQGKPWLHLSEANGIEECVARLREFMGRHRPEVLNVAGSRGSKEPDVGPFVHAVLTAVFRA
jgi:hypothetical protein